MHGLRRNRHFYRKRLPNRQYFSRDRNRAVDSEYVFDLSSKILDDVEISILSKGLKFVPIPFNSKIADLDYSF